MLYGKLKRFTSFLVIHLTGYFSTIFEHRKNDKSYIYIDFTPKRMYHVRLHFLPFDRLSLLLESPVKYSGNFRPQIKYKGMMGEIPPPWISWVYIFGFHDLCEK